MLFVTDLGFLQDQLVFAISLIRRITACSDIPRKTRNRFRFYEGGFLFRLLFCNEESYFCVKIVDIREIKHFAIWLDLDD